MSDSEDFEALFDQVSTDPTMVESFDSPSGTGAKINTGDLEDDGPDFEAVDSDDLELDDDDDDDVLSETDDVDDDDDVVDEDNGDSSDPEIFDWTTVEDQLVEVKVDGQVIRLPLKEAMAGVMRQADYTRKTQELAGIRKAAEWGRQMQVALETDPVGTVYQLAEAFGVALDDSEVDDPFKDVDPELKPVVERIKAIEAENAQLRAQSEQIARERAEAEAKAEVAAVRAKYPDFDPYKVLPLAIDKGLSVEEAYLLNASLEGRTVRTAQAEAEAKAKAKAKAAAAKRKAAQTVSRGGSNVNALDDDPAVFDSFEEMLAHNMQKSRRKELV